MSLFNIRKRHRKPLRIVFTVLILLIGAASWYLYELYTDVFTNNVKNPNVSFYVNQPVPVVSIADSLEMKEALIDEKGFRKALKLMDAEGHIPPGHYSLDPEMSSKQIVNMFRAGMQTPVRLIVRKARLWDNLAADLEKQLRLPADSLLKYLSDTAFVSSLGFTPQTVIAIFLQDTYEVYWTISAKNLIQRMKQEYDRYWTDERLRKAKHLNLTPEEVITLASIVDEETVMTDEQPIVAGLYLNRLQKGWKLQSDPTIRFARKDFESNRVYFKHMEVESAYNTYKNEGLPPGPICIPSKASIEAVLNAEDHEYMYMCAKPDLSGYHNFARTNAQHNINRMKYIRAITNGQQ